MVGDVGAQQYADNLSSSPRAGISTVEKTPDKSMELLSKVYKKLSQLDDRLYFLPAPIVSQEKIFFCKVSSREMVHTTEHPVVLPE